MDLFAYDNKKIRVHLFDGEVLEGPAIHNVADYNEHEYGVNEEGLELNHFLVYKSQIRSIELLEQEATDIRTCERDLLMQFSSRRTFSKNLMKWEDVELEDKYDHNFFEYVAQPSAKEFQDALSYQREEKASFIKLQGYVPLRDSFGLEESICLTMELTQDPSEWKRNPDLEFHMPKYAELAEMERRHFGPLWGESFAVRNVDRLYEVLDYLGAYRDGKLIASCYYFSSGPFTCIDGLVTAEEERHKYVASSLLAEVIKRVPGHTVFLHASEDETPKEMYQKMGFQIVDRTYEYLSENIDKISLKKLEKS